MIIGNGLIAGSLLPYDRNDVTFIAAGVSDSKCNDPASFEREQQLVENTVKLNRERLVVFFSTYSINDPVMRQNLYVRKKIELEKYICTHCSRYLIVRISNLVGHGGNPKNIFNFLFNNIVSGTPFSLWANSYRNLITTEDFALILNHIIEFELEEKLNTTFNIINTLNFNVCDIVSEIEKNTGIAAKYDLVERSSSPYEIDRDAERWFNILNIDVHNYLEKILKTYFAKQIILS